MKPLINKQIAASLKQYKAAAKLQNAEYYDLVRQIAILVDRGGKRMRPLLFMLAYQGYNGTKQKQALKVATSIELLHTFLLIHDDIVDRDRQRWGGHNILGVYFERFAKTMTPLEALHAAESRALLAGDICMTIANDILVNTQFDAAIIVQAQRMLQQTSLQVMSGQLVDIANGQTKQPPVQEQILHMYESKTASYSFTLPLQLAAVTAGAHDQSVLAELGTNLGIAFQLQDDLLGMFGNEAQTGKPVISDLREGKQTVLITKTLELAPAAQQKQLLALLGSDSIGQAELTKAQNIINDCGAKAYVTDLAASHVATALTLIQKTSMNQAAKAELTELAQSLTARTK